MSYLFFCWEFLTLKVRIFAPSQNYDLDLRFFLECSYNGTNYHGWQIQPNAMSVQETLEKALGTLLSKPLSLTAAGRTDTGVHAKQMYAHFDFDEPLDENLVFKLNSFLPEDIAIASIHKVADNAHARFDAIQRTYNYLISPKKNVFSKDLAYDFYHTLDIDLMNKAETLLLDQTDFKCFSKSRTDVKTYNCNIVHAKWTVLNDFLVFEITADRFLRNMVRAIVGTMLNLGLGKISLDEFKTIIESRDRSQAGYSVPAHGLYLVTINYPESTFI